MYLRHLSLKHLKRIANLELSFERADGSPRLWTVLIGENGLCKTTILQAIALLASGPIRANQLAQRQLPSFPDRRVPDNFRRVLHPGDVDLASIPDCAPRLKAAFSMSSQLASVANYPWNRRTDLPDLLQSKLSIENWSSVFEGSSRRVPGNYATNDARPPGRQSKETSAERIERLRLDFDRIRSRNEANWLVVGYGTRRFVPQPFGSGSTKDSALSRLQSLFDEGTLIGPNFIDLLAEGKAFESTLREAMIGEGLLPEASGLALQPRGGVRRAEDFVEGHRITLGQGEARIEIPTTWTSQGYQSTFSWIADLIGQAWLDRGEPVPLAEIEGLVLVDELDLHLHPRWQVDLIPKLKRVFPMVQFIVTTHSPMLLPGLEADEIVRLESDSEGNVVHLPTDAAPALMTGTQIYQTFFGLEGTYPNEAGEKLRRYGVLVGDPTRDDAAEAELQSIARWLRARELDPGWQAVERKPDADAAVDVALEDLGLSAEILRTIGGNAPLAPSLAGRTERRKDGGAFDTLVDRLRAQALAAADAADGDADERILAAASKFDRRRAVSIKDTAVEAPLEVKKEE